MRAKLQDECHLVTSIVCHPVTSVRDGCASCQLRGSFGDMWNTYSPHVGRERIQTNTPNTVMRASIGVCTVGLVVCGRTGGMNDDDDDPGKPSVNVIH